MQIIIIAVSAALLPQCDQVLNDCNQALALEFNNVKALFRRAQAYKVCITPPHFFTADASSSNFYKTTAFESVYCLIDHINEYWKVNDIGPDECLIVMTSGD